MENPPPRSHGGVSANLPARASFEGPVVCSFCGRPQDERRRVIAGETPAVAICEDCVRLCVEIFAES